MLDPHGFVATCNSTHFFIVRRGEVWTSTGDYCLGGMNTGWEVTGPINVEMQVRGLRLEAVMKRMTNDE